MKISCLFLFLMMFSTAAIAGGQVVDYDVNGELYKDRDRMRRLLYGALDAARACGASVNNAVTMGYSAARPCSSWPGRVQR